MKRLTSGTPILALVVALTLAGCDRPAPAPEPRPSPAVSETARSIFRPEFQAAAKPEKKSLVSLKARLLFPEGADLTKTALDQLADVVASPQFKAGGAIVLRGHSDASGGDAANLQTSRSRAEAVRDWMVEQGAHEERITLIAFGEQNPVAPNAKPDGTPNKAGRAVNRRVDITITSAAPPPPRDEPSLAETLAEDEAEEGTTEKNREE